MRIDDADLQARITRMTDQVTDRLGNLTVGTKSPERPDLGARQSELEGRAVVERQLREIEVRQKLADAAKA